MKVDITSMFFNSKIEGKTATPAWRTSIGQNKSKECRIETDVPGVTDIIIGMTYKMRTDLHNLNMTDVSGDLMLCAVFDKIYVNGNRVDGVSYTLLLLRETSDSHEGRLQICYAPKITFNGQSNSATIDRMRETLGCSINGCWFVYEIAIKNQDELHFSAVVVDENQPALYTGTSQDRSRLWRSLLPTADGETSYIPEDDTPLQVIYYGAPGTGKSYCIKEQTAEAEADKRVFRTTFHPDSDYSTFVGCYKPSMESKEKLYDKNELISKLSVIKNTGVTYPCHKFAAKYWESLKQLSREAKKDILSACEFPESMVVEIDKGIVIGEELSHSVDQKQIVYRFVPQAFTNAYVKAYQTTEPVYLVIEEINRGNCAQIFGDLFQLLDRDDAGYSKYPIIADTDLGNHIRERLQSVHIEGIDEAILEGQELVLSSNLYILASMNTSDQSLFPIDSAFKRRWDWKYIPIEDAGKGYTIKVNGHEYDWWTFLEAINKEVFELTNSEDKQMGYFFVKRPDGVIDAETLVSKVYFYLWNDVFKDYDLEGQKAFKKDDNKAISFKEFFAGSKINEALAEQVLLNLGLTYTDHPEL